ncbi:putative addiction module antidote protein [Rickettsiales bacterium]|nr:putative addiction module antidote protein [Rickettsiales bacterium]
MTDINKFQEIELFRNQDEATKKLKESIAQLAKDSDAETFLNQLSLLTKAQGGMSRLSKKVGINRQNLYRTFANDGNPKLRSLAVILKGLGYRLSIEPISASDLASNENVAGEKKGDQEAA